VESTIWAAVVWAVSLPIAIVFARRQGFLAGDDPIVLFRVPIVCFVAPAVALVAILAWGIDRCSRPNG
jgi:hypothetical protein